MWRAHTHVPCYGIFFLFFSFHSLSLSLSLSVSLSLLYGWGSLRCDPDVRTLAAGRERHLDQIELVRVRRHAEQLVRPVRLLALQLVPVAGVAVAASAAHIAATKQKEK